MIIRLILNNSFNCLHYIYCNMILLPRNIVFQKTVKKCFNLIAIRNSSSSNHCLDTIKKFDYENYICTLLLKKQARSCGIAIRAFNVEVARLQDQVSNTQIGEMRMKFWEDAIEQCFAKDNVKIPNHPVIIEVYRALKTNKFTKRHFLSLVTSRRDLMLNSNFKTLEDIEKYVEKSVSSIYYLLLEGSNVRNVNADHAASHLGKAQGISQLLRGIPITRQPNFIALPQDLLLEHKVSHEDILRGKNTANVKEVVFKVATRANQHLEKARSLSDKLPNEAKSVLLPASTVNSYLQRLLKVDCDVFHKELKEKNYSWIPIVWWKNIRKTY